MTAPLPLSTRLWLAWAAFFRVITDGDFAAGVQGLRAGGAPPLPPAPTLEPVPPPPSAVPPTPPPLEAAPDATSALVLLGLLQREGRLIDFLQQDITDFGDADVGAAARVIHEGCQRALRGHVEVAPIRGEPEGEPLVLEAGFAPTRLKLTGNVGGTGPYRGVLRHRGWRVERLELPRPVGEADLAVLAPAELEL